MATAAKSISAGPVGIEPGTAPAPGAADLFATMVAGVGGDGETGPDEGRPAEAKLAEAEQEDAVIDASVLLPMLDQQRAAAPVPQLVPPGAGPPLPATGKHAAPVMDSLVTGKGGVVPSVVDGDAKGSPAPLTGVSPSIDPTPVMRSLKSPSDAAGDTVPVMRPVAPDKSAVEAGKSEIPIMRTMPGAKAADPAPIMRPLSVKPEAALATGKAPVMPAPASGIAKALDSSAPGVAALPVVATAVPGLVVMTGAAGLAAKSDAVAPFEEKPIAPALAATVAAETLPAPAARARGGRPAAAPAAPTIPVETATDPTAAVATDTRVPTVQPVHATPALMQPAAAPLAAPTQNVAAALSQQVLDMSGGDRWIDQIARDISQTAGKDGAMRFRLAPETLGELKVEITQSERGAHVRLHASTEAAQQLLAAAEPRLAAEARAQGVRLAETEIAFSGGQSQGREAGAQAHANAREQGQQAHSNHQPRTPRGPSVDTFTSSAIAPEGRGRTDRYA